MNFLRALFLGAVILVSHNTDATVIPVAIVGSGVAGLSAALYTARAKLPTIVFSGEEPGGQLMGSASVENIPGIPAQAGYKVIESLEEQAASAGAEILYESIISCAQQPDGTFVLTTAEGVSYCVQTVIVATGAAARKLGVPGESDHFGHGVYTCAVCDCRAAQDKDVLIIGGGDAAIEHVMHLLPYARSIKILVRKNAMRAVTVLQERLQQYKNVSVLYEHEIKEVLGNGEYVTGVMVTVSGVEQTEPLTCDAIYLAIGHVPAVQVFEHVVALNEHHCIAVEGRTQKTSVPGIFAAGDVTDHIYRQAGVAAGEGIKAAIDAINYAYSLAR